MTQATTLEAPPPQVPHCRSPPSLLVTALAVGLRPPRWSPHAFLVGTHATECTVHPAVASPVEMTATPVATGATTLVVELVLYLAVDLLDAAKIDACRSKTA